MLVELTVFLNRGIGIVDLPYAGWLRGATNCCWERCVSDDLTDMICPLSFCLGGGLVESRPLSGDFEERPKV